jgi:hypothetical protein
MVITKRRCREINLLNGPESIITLKSFSDCFKLNHNKPHKVEDGLYVGLDLDRIRVGL